MELRQVGQISGEEEGEECSHLKQYKAAGAAGFAPGTGRAA